MKRLILIAAVLILAGCANAQPPQVAVWNPMSTTAVPEEQATAKCEYDLMQNRAAFDNLSVLAGQPRLNNYGSTLYQKCMMAQGYQFGGMVPDPGFVQ
jgi:hypothetical protein